MIVDNDSTQQKGPELAFTLQELSRRLSVSIPWLYGQIKHGALKSTKFGRSTRVLQRDLDAWLTSLPKGVSYNDGVTGAGDER